MRAIALFVSGCLCSGAFAADLIVKRVTIVVMSGGRPIMSEGRLYKVLDDKAAREFVANVDRTGTLDSPFNCKSPMRVWAEPNRDDVSRQGNSPQPCDGKMEFRFEVPSIAATQSDFSRAVSLAIEGKPGAAQFAFSQAAWTADKRGDHYIAAVAKDAAISTAAAALGDANRSTLVTRDPAQAHQMVFTSEGKEALEEFQRKAHLEPTGQLDFATQKALSIQSATSASATNQ